jgi:outer membrane lipoprotein-sorting protein
MKKIIKYITLLFLLLVAVFAICYFAYNEPLPRGEQGKKADELAFKMLKELAYEAYKKTEVLEFTFRDKHHYKWYKQENIVIVSWKQNKVILNTKESDKSEVYIDDEKVVNSIILKQARDFFNNDSFWLVAPYKVFDVGTERRIVKYNDKDALLITYASGGTTPGDSYLWILDKNYMPTSFKMWVKIIPIGGLSATWSDWKTTKSGIKLPTKHTLSLFGLEIPMGKVKAENRKADILAKSILKFVKHEAYKNTHFLE